MTKTEFIKKYYNYAKEAEATLKHAHKFRKKVLRISLEGVEKVFESITAAADSVNAKVSDVSKVLRGKGKTCKGFKFKYYEQ